MKRTILKTIIYFLPLVVILMFYAVLGDWSNPISLNLSFLIPISLPLAAAVLMTKNKWWGCIFGIIMGIAIIYKGTLDTGQVINEIPSGIIFCIYNLICGLITYKDFRRK